MGNGYEEKKERARRASAAQSLAGRDVAPLPAVADVPRRIAAQASLEEFCRAYFKPKFSKPFAHFHLELIAAIERVIRDGGKQAVACPRGSGKTTISTVAAIWAIVTGRRHFVVIVSANTKEARNLLRTIATIIEANALLKSDFPEICVPVARLKGSALLARGQVFYGAPTRIALAADAFRFPTIPGSLAAASIVSAYGVRSAVRGLASEGAEGETLRPDFLFLDDLQTDAVASNPKRVEALEGIVASALEGLGGNGEEIAAIQTCTVKERDDYADRVLNREIYPRWNGLRFASVEKMPTRLDLWRTWRGIWYDDQRAASVFYSANREEMQAGAVVSWPQAYVGETYVDALEYYMAKWADNETAFWSEQQNRPVEHDGAAIRVPAKEIARKGNGLQRGVLAKDCAKVVAHVDVHADVLYYAVIGTSADLTARVVDFGTFPEQKRFYFAKNDPANETLKTYFPGMTADGRLYEGVRAVLGDLLTRSFEVDGEKGFRSIDRILVDVGWKPDVVEGAIRVTDPRRVVPSRGAFVGAKNRPMSEWPKRAGRVFGWHLIDEKMDGMTLRSILFDANYWKTRAHEALGLSPAEKGSLSIFSATEKETRLFCEHLAAEAARAVQCGSRRVIEWSVPPNRPDNHYFDNVAGCLVAAASLGLFPRELGGKN